MTARSHSETRQGVTLPNYELPHWSVGAVVPRAVQASDTNRVVRRGALLCEFDEMQSPIFPGCHGHNPISATRRDRCYRVCFALCTGAAASGRGAWKRGSNTAGQLNHTVGGSSVVAWLPIVVCALALRVRCLTELVWGLARGEAACVETSVWAPCVSLPSAAAADQAPVYCRLEGRLNGFSP